MYPIVEKYFDFIRKCLPDKSETTAVGLDIGGGEVKLIEIGKPSGEFELLNWGIEPVNNDNVLEVTQKLFDKLATPCENPYVSVFGKGTLIRYVDMPRMSVNDLKNSFAIEAEKYFPFSQDQIYTDCYILDPEGKSKHMSVLAAAAKKELVDQKVKLLKDLGLRPEFIGVNPVALANVINVLGRGGDEEKGSGVALLDLGESVSTLSVLVDNLPRFTRDIFVGGRDLTKRISNALGLSFEEAEQLKREPGDRQQEVNDACESALMNIVQELRLSFDYFTTEKNYEIKELLITGGAAMLEGVVGVFEKNLDIKVNRWSPFETLKISSNIPEDEVKNKSFRLGVALGLALYAYD